MEIQLFNSPQFGQVRTAGSSDSPLFCAVDIARALGYANPAKAIIDHCKGVTVLETPTAGGVQQMKYISEPDMYRLIFKSSAPNAEQFNSWVSEEVLPQIRRTGGYIPIGEQDSEQDILAKAVLIANKSLEEKERRIRMLEGQKEMLEKENKDLAPKAQYTDEVLQASSTYTHTQMAKELNFRSVRTFTAACQKDHILYRQSNTWLLYSKYSGKGYMKTRTHTYNTASGMSDSNTITVWTEEGRRFLHEHFDVALKPVDFSMFDFSTDTQ